MPVLACLSNEKKKIQSKYHQFSKEFELKYVLLHRELTSRFHRESNETALILQRINSLLIHSRESFQSKFNSTKFIPAFSKTSTINIDMFYPDIIDWFQGRFSGQIIRICVRDGKIIEKIFLSPKGNKIIVRRGKLDLRMRSILTMRIQLKLRIRSVPFIQIRRKFINVIAFDKF